MKQERNAIMPFIKAAGGIILVVALLILFLIYIYRHREIIYFIFTPFIIALIIAYFFNPIVDFMEKRNISRALAILVIYIVFGLLILVACIRFLPNLLNDLQELGTNFPHYARKAHEYLLNLQDDYRRFNLPPPVREIIDQNMAGIESALVSRLENIYGFIISFFNSMVIMILVPIFTFFIIRDKQEIKAWIINSIPSHARRRFTVIGKEIDTAVGRYLRGMVLISFLVGLMVYLGLLLLDVKFALFLGFLNGLTNFIPIIGPFIGGIPAVIVAFISSPAQAIKVTLLILIIQQVEGNLIAPLIFSHSLKFHPLVVILLLLAAGKLFGFAGLLLALPVAAVLRIIAKHLLDVSYR